MTVPARTVVALVMGAVPATALASAIAVLQSVHDNLAGIAATVGAIIAVGGVLAVWFLNFRQSVPKMIDEKVAPAFERTSEVEKEADERHKENQAAIRQLEGAVRDLTAAVMGVSGTGGLLRDRDIDRSRRNDLADRIMVVETQLDYLSAAVKDMASKAGVRFDQGPVPRRRPKAGDSVD